MHARACTIAAKGQNEFEQRQLTLCSAHVHAGGASASCDWRFEWKRQQQEQQWAAPGYTGRHWR
eukprot:scaffold65278_cov24-Tisochrysis_lutea.AAC.2